MIVLVLSAISLTFSVSALTFSVSALVISSRKLTKRKLTKLEEHVAQLDLDVTMLIQNNNTLDK